MNVRPSAETFTIPTEPHPPAPGTSRPREAAAHQQDLVLGRGVVYLPRALLRKYPNAAREWAWQYIFSAEKLSVDPRFGEKRPHHVGEKNLQNGARRKRCQMDGPAGEGGQ